MEHHFFAYISRMKFIQRWGLMRNTQPENDMEHALQTAMIAHAMAVMGNVRYNRGYNAEYIMALAVYHDSSEVITGDLPTPVKYKTPDIQDAYRELETHAKEQLLDMLPADLRPHFTPYVQPDESSYEWHLVKSADRISAYLKCIEEEKMGNRDFEQARATILQSLALNPLPEVQDFMRDFVPSFSLSMDELSR